MGIGILKAGEGFVQSLGKNLSTSYGELAAEIAGNYSKSVERNAKAQILNAVAKTNSQEAKKLINAIPDTADAVFARNMQRVVNSGISDKEKFNWIRQQQVERHGTIFGNAAFAGQVAKAYMFEDGKKAARIGTYVGASVGLRVISGGNLTHNNTGERDIAGIPFI